MFRPIPLEGSPGYSLIGPIDLSGSARDVITLASAHMRNKLIFLAI
jgi:hypothetical protein